MHISITRSEHQIPGAHYHPVEHFNKEYMAHDVHRVISIEDRPDVIRKHPKSVELDEIDLILASGNQEYASASVEDPYNRGRFINGFVYVRALAAFMHEDLARRHVLTDFADLAGRVGTGAILGRDVKIGPGAQIGSFVEVHRGAQIMDDAVVGDGTILRKGAQVSRGAEVGAHGYVGQFARVAPGVKVGSFGMIQHSVQFKEAVIVGSQASIGRGTYFDKGVYAGDSVTVGRNGYFGPNVVVGEMTTIGDNPHVGGGSSIGAESRFGHFVRVAKNTMLVSPTYAEDGEIITESNLFARRPRAEE
ncbi:hypothetical protein KA047_00515 [Candidatus Saccharibacteria bacterium]|nr:hypothetical protein [Candidatus Saccharibacteria bacterium]